MIRKIINKIRHIWNLSVTDKNVRKFIRHNKKVWHDWGNGKSKFTILTDFYGVSQTIIAFSYFLNILARKHNAAIKFFVPNKYSYNPALRTVYRSFNVSGHIVISLTRSQKRRASVIYKEILPTLQSKQDLFYLNVLGVWIGVDIYESYLKDHFKPTVYLNDPNLFKKIKEGINLAVFWEDYFSKNKIKAVISSHDCYSYFNIVCKVAYKYKVPVYFPNPIYLNRAERPYSVHSYFPDYRKMFRRLSDEEQKKGIELACAQLEKRFSGKIGVDMPHNTKSAFHSNYDGKPALRKSGNIKVLICSHCFYDNPHAYGNMLFLDFYDWLNYLGRLSEKTDYDWYLKMHPDPLPGTLEIIQGILAQHPRIMLISHEVSFHQLVKEGLDFVLTAYGSVGEECPLIGAQVINAGYNPRIAYDFNWHPKSPEEYEYYLLNLDKLDKDIKKEDIYEFYFMNHYYIYDDDLVFQSYRQFLSDLTREEQIGSRSYKYFLDQWSDVKHSEIINNMQRFIDSGKKHYFSHGPE